MPAPDQDLVDLESFLLGGGDGLFGLDLVIQQLPIPVVGVHGDEHAASGVRDTATAGRPAEAAEHLGVNDAETRAGEHGDWKVGDHRHMERHAVTLLEPTEVTEKRGELIDALVQLLVGDRLRDLVLRLRDPDQGGFIPVLRQVPIDAVVGRVQPATDKPLPERGVAGVEGGMPVLIPGQQIRILLEALGEVLLLEPVEDARVARIGLANEFRGRGEVLLFSPVDRDLRFGDFHVLRRFHYLIGLDRHRLMQPPSEGITHLSRDGDFRSTSDGQLEGSLARPSPRSHRLQTCRRLRPP